MPNLATLQSSGQPQTLSPYVGLVRRPDQLLCRDGIIFDALEQTIRRHYFQHILPSRMNEAERYLLIQGEPGSGKSAAACDASLRFGFGVLMLPAAMLASEHEGGATQVLDDILRYTVSYSQQHSLRMGLVADDFDLGIGGNDARTGKTINSNLLTQRLQYLADNRDQYRNFDGTGISVIFTGNDFTNMRASLFRPGRATWFTHAPTADEKLLIAFQLLKPVTVDDRRLVEKLARVYRDESVAFWMSLKNDLIKDRLDDVIRRGFPDVASAEAELSKPTRLNPERLSALAKARATTKPHLFL